MDVLVIKCGKQTMEELRELRDFAVESLARGVLVLGLGCSWSVEDLPELLKVDAPRLTGKAEAEGELLREKNIEFRVGPQIITGAGAKRKLEILDRLTKYRKTHGQGCFASLEGAKGVNATLLRGLLTGLTKADMQTWEAVDKALDKLEGGHG